MINLTKGKIVRTKKVCCDEDWKTQMARGYDDIPKGAEVVVQSTYSNLYGSFVDVLYNRIVYSVKEEDLEEIGK